MDTNTNFAVCVPYGDQGWTKIWTYYSSKIVPYLDRCHVSDRYNPLAWMDCANALDHREVVQWGQDLWTLTQVGFKTDGDLSGAFNDVSLFSDSNWQGMLKLIDS